MPSQIDTTKKIKRKNDTKENRDKRMSDADKIRSETKAKEAKKKGVKKAKNE